MMIGDGPGEAVPTASTIASGMQPEARSRNQQPSSTSRAARDEAEGAADCPCLSFMRDTLLSTSRP